MAAHSAFGLAWVLSGLLLVGAIATAFPDAPNGAEAAAAALCNAAGNVLAMMPHPERCFLAWQQPWYPAGLGLEPKGPGPWLRLFQNAREWAEKTPPAAVTGEKQGAR